MHRVAYESRKSIFSEIFDLSPECPEAGTFPISLKESHKSAYRLQQGCSAVVITLGNGNFESIGCNQIIVLIVLIVTRCLNEAISFSLFNATQILSIPIRENLAVVFIVLIVLIVTRCLNEPNVLFFV